MPDEAWGFGFGCTTLGFGFCCGARGAINGILGRQVFRMEAEHAKPPDLPPPLKDGNLDLEARSIELLASRKTGQPYNFSRLLGFWALRLEMLSRWHSNDSNT